MFPAPEGFQPFAGTLQKFNAYHRLVNGFSIEWPILRDQIIRVVSMMTLFR
jgi:hypothetical protein